MVGEKELERLAKELSEALEHFRFENRDLSFMTDDEHAEALAKAYKKEVWPKERTYHKALREYGIKKSSV